MVTISPIVSNLDKTCFLCSTVLPQVWGTRRKPSKCGYWKQTAPYIVAHSCFPCRQMNGNNSKLLDEKAGYFVAALRSRIITAFALEFGVDCEWLDAMFSEHPIKVSRDQRLKGRTMFPNHYDKLAILLGKYDLDVIQACQKILLEQFGVHSNICWTPSRKTKGRHL
jgi:hypothetical protein